MSAAKALRFDLLSGPAAPAEMGAVAWRAFQHPDWVRAVAGARGRAHTMLVVRARWPDGRQAMLPGATHRRWGLTVFESMPMGGYGGWLADQPLAPDDERDLNRHWLAQARWPVVVLTSPPGRASTLPAARGGGFRRLAPRGFVTHLLDLSGDEAALLQRTRQRMRSYLRKFDQLGFAFERACDAPALEELERWYRQGSQDWARPATSLMRQPFFAALADGRIAEVWTVRQQGRAVGAALFLVGDEEVQYQASGTQRIDGPVSAMEALLWQAARHYRGQGLATMNLGASEGLDTVARFKEKFGACAVAYVRATYLLPALLGSQRQAAVVGVVGT